MVSTLIIDLEKEYLSSKGAYVDMLKEKYNMIIGGRNKECFLHENCVVITDNKSAGDKWNTFAVIGIEHSGAINGVEYVTDSMDGVDGEYIEMVYARKFKLPITIIETKNLIVREMTVGDVEEICGLYQDKENVRFLPEVSDVCEEQVKAAAYIDNMYALYGYGMWVIVHKDSGRIIGRAGIEHREIDGEIYRELGYFLEKEYQGQGYAYEVASKILKWAESNYIEEMVVYVNEKNAPSEKLARKLGFSLKQTKADGAENYMLFYKKLV